MDKTAIKLVTDYVLSHLDKSDKTPEFDMIDYSKFVENSRKW